MMIPRDAMQLILKSCCIRTESRSNEGEAVADGIGKGQMWKSNSWEHRFRKPSAYRVHSSAQALKESLRMAGGSGGRSMFSLLVERSAIHDTVVSKYVVPEMTMNASTRSNTSEDSDNRQTVWRGDQSRKSDEVPISI